MSMLFRIGAIRKVITTPQQNYKGDLVTVKIGRFNEPVSLTGDHMVYVVGGRPTYSRNIKIFLEDLLLHEIFR